MPLRATPAQRAGIVLGLIEAVLFAFVAALHFGWHVQIGGVSFAAPFLYPAGIVEGVLALALLLSVILPGPGTVRAGRVLGSQILAIIGMFVNQVALMRGVELMTWRNELFYGCALLLALISMALIASPSLQRRVPVP